MSYALIKFRPQVSNEIHMKKNMNIKFTTEVFSSYNGHYWLCIIDEEIHGIWVGDPVFWWHFVVRLSSLKPGVWDWSHPASGHQMALTHHHRRPCEQLLFECRRRQRQGRWDTSADQQLVPRRGAPHLTFHQISSKSSESNIESDHVIYFDSSWNHLYNTFSVLHLFVFF